MRTRTIAIVLGIALAASVGVNLFAATAAYSVMRSKDAGAPHLGSNGETWQPRPSTRELIGSLSADARQPVQQALRAAAQRARPEFQAAREARRQAIIAAASPSMDPAGVTALLEQSRTAEARGRLMLETDAVAILGTLSPADRAIFAQILNGKDRSAGRDRQHAEAPPSTGRPTP